MANLLAMWNRAPSSALTSSALSFCSRAICASRGSAAGRPRGRGAGVATSPFPAGPLPHPACAFQRTGRSTCLARWSAAGGGCWFRGPRGRDFAAAVAVALHGDAGCAGEDDPVAGEPPLLVAEAVAECCHPEPVFPRVLGAYPAHQPTPGEVVDRAERGLGDAVPEVVRPSGLLRGATAAADVESSRLRS